LIFVKAKPFSLRELVARIRAVSRRAGRPEAAPTLRAGPVEVDVRARRVTVSGREVELTPKEFDLLARLAAEPGTVLSKQRLLEEVWGGGWYGAAKTVDVHVASLRRKLGDPTLVETIRGVGLRLRE
jgi:DNA-binding response OmpR family regulator